MSETVVFDAECFTEIRNPFLLDADLFLCVFKHDFVEFSSLKHTVGVKLLKQLRRENKNLHKDIRDQNVCIQKLNSKIEHYSQYEKYYKSRKYSKSNAKQRQHIQKKYSESQRQEYYAYQRKMAQQFEDELKYEQANAKNKTKKKKKKIWWIIQDWMLKQQQQQINGKIKLFMN